MHYHNGKKIQVEKVTNEIEAKVDHEVYLDNSKSITQPMKMQKSPPIYVGKTRTS